MKILISAAETSSDAHGAELLKAIRESVSQDQLIPVDAFGIGGPKLQAQGLRTIVDARELLAMGFTEIFSRLPRIFRALTQVTQAAIQEKPDVVVVIDYPDFHFRLAKRLQRLSIPLVYYIPPKVWVWRKGRVHTLKKLFSRILCIFPFEETFYKDLNIPVKYVGNPLVDELPLKLTRKEAREKIALGQEDPAIVIMPGSRASELKQHLELFLDAVSQSLPRLKAFGLISEIKPLRVLMPFPLMTNLNQVQERIDRKLSALQSPLWEVRVFQGNSAECMIAADAGLIKSGTSTLEAGLLRCPHSVVYKPSAVSHWIYKNLIRYKGPVGLVNLVAGWKPGDDYVAREILCEEVTLPTLSTEIVDLMTSKEKREKLLHGFEKLRSAVFGKNEFLSPSRVAAQEILSMIEEKRR
jgi:lipid-A-disaccharide synthase